MAASSSFNINLSAKIDLNLSISVLFPTGQVVNVSGSSVEIPMPTGCNETLARTDISATNENSDINLESVSNSELVQRFPDFKNNLESMSDSEPVQSCSDSENNGLGPFNDAALSRLANAFAAIFDRPESSLSVACGSPLSSPVSPSFSGIDPNDLFWIPLPEMDDVDDVIESPIGKDDTVVVEIISCDSDQADDDVVFLKEIRRSGPKAE